MTGALSSRPTGSAAPPAWGPATAFILIAVAVVLQRLPTLPFAYLNVDESAYLAIGSALRHGAIPYVDIIDRKPVGIYLVYALADALFADAIVGARVLGGLCSILSAGMIAGIGRRHLGLSWPAATLAGVLFSVYAIAYGGDAAQYNVFVMPFVAGAVALVLRALDRIDAGAAPSAAGIGLAGLLLGLAMQVKYTPAFEAIGLGLLLIVAGWRRRAALGTHGNRTLAVGLLLMIVGGLAPTLAAAAVYWRLGHLDAFIFYNFTVNLVRTATDYPPGLLALRIAVAALIAHPLIGFSLVYGDALRRGAVSEQPSSAWVRPALLVWLGAALLAALVQRQPYLHYFYAAVPPLALFMAAALAGHGRFGRGARIATAVYLVLPVIGYFVGWRYETADHGSAMLPREIARTLRQEKVQSLYVFNYFGILYHLSGLPPPTRYTLPTHLLRDLEAASFRFDASGEVARILASHPEAVVVVRPYAANVAADRVMLLEAALRDGYCTGHVYEAGRDKVYVYRYAGEAGDPARPCSGEAARGAPAAQSSER
jgi:hypothetical protein